MKFFLLIYFLFSSLLFSQEHFILDIEETGESTLFIFQNDIASLNDDDELGIFDANGIVDSDGNFGELLVGTGIWSGNQLEIVAIMGVDLSQFGGPILPGAVSGNSMILKVWKPDMELEYIANYSIEVGSGNFDDIFSVISNIDCPEGTIVDECGVCNGLGAIYECGCYELPLGNCDCYGNVEDCSGQCGGNLVIDECGVCGGDNSTCEDCAGEPNGNANLDECGVCNGPGIIDGFCDCDNNILDCLGVCGGSALVDNCGVCDGYNTSCDSPEAVLGFYDMGGVVLTNLSYEGLISEVCLENSILSSPMGTSLQIASESCITPIDNAGIISIYMKNNQPVSGFQFTVIGLTVLDASGGAAEEANFTVSTSESIVVGFSFSGSVIEASGDFYGCIDQAACNFDINATLDDNSCEYPEIGYDCDGNCLEEDCLGECGGDAIIDECGICEGPGSIYECGCYDIPDDDCDCDGNVFDCEGICGGTAEFDCLNICNGNAILDECGICEGQGATFECDDGSFACSELDCGDGGDDGGDDGGGGGGTGGECNEGEIFDCFGNCGPEIWLGDGYCDESMIDYNCLEYAYDMGDCSIDFEPHISSILSSNCTGYCHSGTSSYDGGLNLESYSNLMLGGNHGPAVTPYYPDYSIIIQKLSENPPFGSQMPLASDPLSSGEFYSIYYWIEQGAIAPDDDGWEGGCVEDGLIEDCTGECVDETLLGDGNCDDGEEGEADFNCAALLYDYGFGASMPDCPVGVLEFGEATFDDGEGTLEILMDCEFPVSDFEIAISGLSMVSASGGAAEDANFNVLVLDSIIQGSSLDSLTYVPQNSGLLTIVNFDEIINSEICFENSIITTNIGMSYAAILGDCIDVSNWLSADDAIPLKLSINKIYPNPFNPVTYIDYSVSENESISLNIYDINGRHINSLFNNKFHLAGDYNYMFNASNLPSGVYIVKLESLSHLDYRKVILTK